MAEKQGFSTRAIHGAYRPERYRYRPIVEPIFAATTYEFLSLEENEGFFYSRLGNPNRHSLETILASLEKAKHGLCFSSGMGAITAVLLLLKEGDHLISQDEVYGGTQLLLSSNLGFEVEQMDLANNPKETLRKHIKPNTKMVYTESLSNPNLKLANLRAIAEAIQEIKSDIILVVDNTFLSPYIMNPLELGASIVIHSLTKYINGHGDVIMGGAVVNDEKLYQSLKAIQGPMGLVPSPFDAYQVCRGVKTLALRMERHSASARKVAEFLESHDAVSWLCYPGLPSYPQAELAQAVLKSGPASGMIAFRLAQVSGLTQVEKFVKKLNLIILTGSLGMAETTIQHPATLSHKQLSREEQEKRGIYVDLLRLSIGLEDPDDIIDDLRQALNVVLYSQLPENFA